MVVGVDDVALLMAVAGHMELDDAIARHAMQEIVGGELVVEGAHIDVVDVEQQPAIGAPRHLAHELPLGHLRLAEGDVARHVLEREAAAEKILYLADAIDDVVERLLGVRDGQEVVQVHPVHAGPAQMIGDPFGVHALGKFLQRAEIVHVERRGRGDGERYAVHHDGVALADLVEHVQGLAALDHVVLGDDLEPIDGRVAVKDLLIMLGPEPQAKAEIRRLVAGHGLSS